MQRLYAGIDLHSTNSVVVVQDEEDRVVARRRVRNCLELVKEVLEPYREELAGIAVESTYNWYWLVDGLREADYVVSLANPAGMQQYEGLKYSDDESDARWLAKLLRLGILPQGYIYPKEERPVRDLLRKRAHLVRQHTAQVLSVQNLLARNTGSRFPSNRVKGLKEEEVERLLGTAELALAVQSSLCVLECLKIQIKRLENVVVKRASLREEFRLLLSVPGIGRVLALTIMLETGDTGRFGEVGDYVSYARCVNSARISNAKKKGSGNAKNGNRYLAWAFVEAANFAVRYNPRIRRYYQRKLVRTNKAVAIKAVAHKLARASFHVMRDQVPFDDVRAFG